MSFSVLKMFFSVVLLTNSEDKSVDVPGGNFTNLQRAEEGKMIPKILSYS
jgi:hypothetical protein